MLRPWPVGHILALVYIFFFFYLILLIWFIFISLRNARTLPCH